MTARAAELLTIWLLLILLGCAGWIALAWLTLRWIG